jgi:hypothetical protein
VSTPPVQAPPPAPKFAEPKPAEPKPAPPKAAPPKAAPPAAQSAADGTAGTAPRGIDAISIDPHSLRPSLTLRAGLDAVRVDAERVTIRTKASRERVAWSEVTRFESYIEGDPTDPDARGYLILRTVNDAIDLPATRGNVTELEHAQAVLEAYRLRANARRSGRTG